jgi:hypothetical protein
MATAACPLRGRAFQRKLSSVLAAQRGCPMNRFEMSADVPSMVALMAFVSLWGVVASTAAMYLATLGH